MIPISKHGLMTVIAAVSLVALGCGDDDGTTPGTDSGPPPADTGTPGEDSGTPGEDSGTPAEDSGTPAEDSGAPAEDSGTPAGGCATGYAGCATFTDMTGSGTVMIDTTALFSYDPECVRVSVGQMVTIAASAIHPLMGSCGPGDMNPITDMSTTSQTVTFTTAGVYGFHCNIHGAPDGTGMAGAIEVVP